MDRQTDTEHQEHCCNVNATELLLVVHLNRYELVVVCIIMMMMMIIIIITDHHGEQEKAA